MTADPSILWFDFETFGSLSRPWDRRATGPFPRRDRPAQFGGIRTTMDLELVGDPVELHARPPVDEPPSVEACLVTGIAPSDTLASGTSESTFFEGVLDVLSVPRTTGAGWNSLGYDDEIVRFGAWRNLLPPYAREYANGNARFDLLPVFRLAWSTGRRDGIEWKLDDEGRPSFSLEDVAGANGIDDHAATAHDALADVRATIELARIMRRAQPRLWEYALSLRDRHSVSKVVDTGRPFVLSDKGLWDRGHATIGLALAETDRNGRLVLDLHDDPAMLLELEPRQLHARFHRIDPDGERVPIRRLRVNKLPMVADPKVLGDDSEVWTSIGIDPEILGRRVAFVRENHARIVERVGLVADEPPPNPDTDAEEMLYGGRFASDADTEAMRLARRDGAEAVRRLMRNTRDERIEELAFRFLAREHAAELSSEERARWETHLRDRLLGSDREGRPRAEGAIEHARSLPGGDADRARVVEDVNRWIRDLLDAAGVAAGDA